MPRAKTQGRQSRRLVLACPLCGKETAGKEGLFFQTLARRRHGCIDPNCLLPVMETIAEAPREAAFLALGVEGESFGGMERFTWFLYDDSGARVAEGGECLADPSWRLLMEGACATPFADIAREWLLVALEPGDPGRFLRGEPRERFRAIRRTVLSDFSSS